VPFPKYDSSAHNTLFQDAARAGVYYWAPMYKDVKSEMVWGRCYKCHYPMGITSETLEGTFWNMVHIGGVPKARCDNCGTKLEVPDRYATKELLVLANHKSVLMLQEESMALARTKLDQIMQYRQRTTDGAPAVGENLLCDIWGMLTENYGDLPPAVQMWLEENDGIEEQVLKIRERQKRISHEPLGRRWDPWTKGFTGP